MSGKSSRTVSFNDDAMGNRTSAIIASPVTTAILTRRLTWGQDLAGSPSLQGAGGVGGLLMVEEITSTTNEAYHFHYDGNGNVTEITDHLGASVATYRYDAFGNTLVAAGTYAATNRYRFSTKPLDDEVTTAPLYYYGYRYFDPVTGRWPSRDPIEEEGGVNLYGFVGNDGVSNIDFIGNKPFRANFANKAAKKKWRCWAIATGTCSCCKNEGSGENIKTIERECGKIREEDNLMEFGEDADQAKALEKAKAKAVVRAEEECVKKDCPLKDAGACLFDGDPDKFNNSCELVDDKGGGGGSAA